MTPEDKPDRQRQRQRNLAVGETVILLHPP